MDERTVVRHQQQAGGVVIQMAYGLHAAVCELFRQQRQHAGMVAGLARAFVVGRFVQCEVEMLAVLPWLAVHAEFEGVRLESAARIFDDFAADGDFAIRDQPSAPFAGAEALRLQDAIQG